jgi:hypothetical protein
MLLEAKGVRTGQGSRNDKTTYSSVEEVATLCKRYMP